MTKRSRVKFGVVLAASLLALGLGAGAAYGYFTSTGSGTGSASTGTLANVTLIAVTGTPSTPLYPGGTGDVTFDVNNPNNYPVTITSFGGAIGLITVSGGSGCTSDNSGVTLNDETPSITIPASTSDYSVDLAGAVSMSASSYTGCQGATFAIPVTITVTK